MLYTHAHIQCTHSDMECDLESVMESDMDTDTHTDTHSDMESDADSIKACVHSYACHLYCSIVTTTSAKVERQRQYIACINADPQKREEFLMRDRLRKKKK